MWTLVGMLGMLTMLRALGETMLRGLAAFCTVSESVTDTRVSTAVAGAWGRLDGIASSRSGSRASSGVTLWTEYIPHCGTKFDSCICEGAPVAAS